MMPSLLFSGTRPTQFAGGSALWAHAVLIERQIPCVSRTSNLPKLLRSIDSNIISNGQRLTLRSVLAKHGSARKAKAVVRGWASHFEKSQCCISAYRSVTEGSTPNDWELRKRPYSTHTPFSTVLSEVDGPTLVQALQRRSHKGTSSDVSLEMMMKYEIIINPS